ncbi:MAG: OmpH family outer membrane protein [Planctomycetes bacterium]|nr:OmpH family outer membrane protein [Planctomycetota bacterium]
MKKFVSMATLVASVWAASQGMRAEAQQARPPIAVIDVTAIFKDHYRLKAMMNDLQQQIAAAEQEIQKQRQTYEALGAKMTEGQLKRGSPEYKALEEQLRKIESETSVKIAQQRRDFHEQQAKMYYSVYQEIQQEVKRYCEANGVFLVMRFLGEQPDQNDPDQLYRDLNRSVVHYHPHIDITKVVLAQLNANSPPPVAGPVTPGAPGPNNLQPQGMSNYGAQPGVNPGLGPNPGATRPQQPMGIPQRR